MDFKSDKPIYMQIVNYICEKILQEEWAAEERLPSVRELSANLAVNPNTVMRSYEILERDEIIFNRRGIGFSVSADAKEKIASLFKKEFLGEELPYFFRKMQMLDITLQEIETEFNNYLKK